MVQTFTGKAEYTTGLVVGNRQIKVALTCLVDGIDYPLNMMLDTGASWSMLRADVAQALGYPFNIDPDVDPIRTIDGLKHGSIEKLMLTIEADEGDSLELEVSWFICEHWDGPNTIGWHGCLEHFKFSLDPLTDTFYFAELHPRAD